MNVPVFEEIVAELYGHDCTVFPFWRGESLKHKYFMCMIKELHKVAKDIVLATNGTLINHDTLPPTILKLLDVVSVSIQSEPSMAGLRRLRDMRRAMLGSDFFFKKPKIVASMVAGLIFEGFNRNVIDNLTDDKFRLYTRHTTDRNGKFIGWGAIEWGSNVPEPLPGRKFCERLNTDLVIAWDGSVSRCCYVWETMQDLNVRDMSIEDIWLSPQFQHIRENYPDEICARCDQWIGAGKTL